MSAQKHPPTIEIALLGLIRRQSLHPYEIFQQMQRGEALGFLWRLKQSHLYALLDRLEADGYLKHQLEIQDRRPPRKIISLTPHGEAVFTEWLTTPVHHGRDMRLEFLAKLYFARSEGDATLRLLLERQQACCQQWLHEIEAQIAALPPERSFERLVMGYRLGQVQATLAWLTQCQQQMMAEESTI